jgi:hypothetical protein
VRGAPVIAEGVLADHHNSHRHLQMLHALSHNTCLHR